MGLNDLAARSDGQTVQADDVNQYRNALIGDLVPRNASGAPESVAGNLGSSSLPFGSLYLSSQFIQNGNVIDLSSLSGESHQIVSGTALTSGYPDFLTFVASSTTGRILGTSTALSLIINNIAVTISSNIDVTGLTLGPSANHTCLVNNSALTGQASTKTLGEAGETLAIGTIGSAISALDGTIQVFQKGSEYFLALVDTSNNKLWPFKRGIAKTDREALTNGDTITLRQGNYIFINSDGSTTYKSTIFPSYLSTQPSSPASNQWNFNTTNKRWERYSGSWSNMSAHWLGIVICDSSAAVASHSNDFNLNWKSSLEGSLLLVDVDKIRVFLKRINVAGRDFYLNSFGSTISLSNSGDREGGVSETASTTYYLYCDNNLKIRFSNLPPRFADQRLGLYHPKQYWRYLGSAYNNYNSDLVSVTFDGKTRVPDVVAPLAYPTGYRGTTVPVYVNSTDFSVAAIKDRDSADLINITKATSTTVSTGSTGLNGIARTSANLTGTIAYTNGSATVTGTGTTFTADYAAGDTVWDQTNSVAVGVVLSVGSDSSLTLVSNFSGTTRSGATHRRGAKVNDSFLHAYTVTDGLTAGIILHGRNTASGQTLPAADFPAGYSSYRQLPFAVKIDASGNIIPFMITQGWPYRPKVRYMVGMDHGGIANYTTTRAGGALTATTYTAVSLSSFVPPVSKLCEIWISNPSASGLYLGLRATGSSVSIARSIGFAASYDAIIQELDTNSSQSIDYKVNGASINIAVYSWTCTEVN